MAGGKRVETAIVVGGGFAGMAAASELAARGARVTVLEKAPRLGGRASSFLDRASGERCDNGQHLLIAGYRNARAFLERTGAAADVRFQDAMEVTFALPGGRLFPFKASARLPAPLHLMPAFLAHPLLGMKERLAAARAGSAALLMSERELRELEPLRFSEWLARMGQPRALVDAFWEVLTLAAVNLGTDDVSAYPILRVFRLGFMGSADAARLGYATVPLGDLFEPAAALVRARGGLVRTRARVHALAGEGTVLLEGGERLSADVVISALPTPALRSLRPELVPAGLDTAPIVDVHLWLDREVVDATLVALLGAKAAQWVWNRGRMVRASARFAGPAGAVAREEAGVEAETAGAPSKEAFRKGVMLSVTISGADRALEMPPREIEAAVLADLRAFFPRMAEAKVLRALTVKEPHATLRLLPGAEALRPGARTADPRLLLAGDWTDTGLPSTIEGAVLSGFRAVEAALGGEERIVLPLEANEGRVVRAMRKVAGGR